MTIHTRYLTEKDLDALHKFVEEVPPHATIYVKRPLADFEDFPGWWYGAFNPEQGDKLEAIACVEGTTGNIVGLTREGLSAMARDRLGAAGATSESDGRSHQILGVAEAIDVFWSLFQNRENRGVVRDSRRTLVGCTEVAPDGLVAGIDVAVATQNDFKLVAEFAAEHSLEQWGSDPRRQNKAAHEERVRATIASGRQLTGRQGPRPLFIAELIDLDDGVTMIDKVYVPRPFRRRRPVMGSLAWSAKKALETADEVVFFFDEENEYFAKASEKAGFSVRETYRFIMLR